MFGFVDLFFQATIGLGNALTGGFHVVPYEEIEPPRQIAEYKGVKYHNVVSYFASKESRCDYEGVVVPFVRDKDEEMKRGGETEILKADPTAIIGWATVFTHKTCGDGTDVKGFFIGARPYSRLPLRPVGIMHTIYDYSDRPASLKPIWFDQVKAVLKKKEETGDAGVTDALKAMEVTNKKWSTTSDTVSESSISNRVE